MSFYFRLKKKKIVCVIVLVLWDNFMSTTFNKNFVDICQQLAKKPFLSTVVLTEGLSITALAYIILYTSTLYVSTLYISM